MLSYIFLWSNSNSDSPDSSHADSLTFGHRLLIEILDIVIQGHSALTGPTLEWQAPKSLNTAIISLQK